MSPSIDASKKRRETKADPVTTTPAPLFQRLALVCLLLASSLNAQDGSERLRAGLEEAKRIYLIRPWHETQMILDEIRPWLDRASDEQRADFRLIEARNQILSGDIDGGLTALDELRNQTLTSWQALRAVTLGANAAVVARRYDRAFELLTQALDHPDLEQHPDNAANVMSLASYAYSLVGQPDLGLEYGQRALIIAAGLEDRGIQCVAAQRLGYAYKIMQRFEPALSQYQTALELCERAGDSLLRSITMYSLADLLRRNGDHALAENLFDQSMLLLDREDYASGIAEARLYRARLAQERANWALVEQLGRQTLSTFERDHAWDYLAEAHLLLGEAAARRIDHLSALEHFKARLAAVRRSSNQDRTRRQAYLEVQFDTRFQELEIELLREQSRVARLQAEAQRKDAQLRWTSGILGAVVILIMGLWLARALRERRHFHRLSQTDGLTRLYNHTRFFDLIDSMVQRAAAHNRSLVLVLADIDHFKRVNDRFGHLIGDEVLRQTARVLRETFDEPAIVGRVGGEEFAIGLADRSLEQAVRKIETLRERLAGHARRRTDPPITLSFGLALLRRGESVERLRSRADQALYQAKHQGRNRMVIAEA